MRFSLSKKITLATQVSIWLTVIFISFVVFYFLQNTLKNSTDLQLSSISDLKSNSLNSYFNESLLEITNAANSKLIKNDLISVLKGKNIENGPKILDILSSDLIESENLIDISIINGQGVVIFSTDKTEEGKVKTNETFFLNAKETPFVQTFVYDLESGLPINIIAAPIKDENNNFIGILSERTKVGALNKLLSDRAGLGATGETFLINSSNIVTTDLLKEPNAVLKKTIYLPQINLCLEQSSNFYLSNDYHGDKVFGYAKWIPEIKSCLVSKIDQSEIMKPVLDIFFLMLLIILIFSLFVMFLDYLLSKSIVKPLRVLRNQTSKIKEGNFDFEIDAMSNDEVGDLALSFKKVLYELKNSYKNLENEVNERTVDLNKKVSELAENNLELVDSQKAIVNLIEDIEDEKNEIEKIIKIRTKELSDEKSRLLSSINSLSFGFIIMSVDGHVILSNPVLLTILDVTKPPKDIQQLAKFFNNFDFINSYNQCVATQETVEIKEVEFNNKVLRLFYTPIVNINKIIDYVVIIEDITESKILERSKDEFFAVASHELRTPLTAIRGNADMILDMYSDQIPNADVKEMLKDINLASIRLIDIVNDFLEVTRLEQGKMEMKIEIFELPELINKVIKNLSGIADKKNISITYSLPTVNLPEVLADKNRTEEVLINVISNAIKFTDGGNIFITNEENGGYVTVHVADTGRGIDTKNQALLFRKFQQANDKILIRNDSNSTGLGLYISKLLLLNMGGDIFLEKSELGSGSTFAFTLPVAM